MSEKPNPFAFLASSPVARGESPPNPHVDSLESVPSPHSGKSEFLWKEFPVEKSFGKETPIAAEVKFRVGKTEHVQTQFISAQQEIFCWFVALTENKTRAWAYAFGVKTEPSIAKNGELQCGEATLQHAPRRLWRTKAKIRARVHTLKEAHKAGKLDLRLGPWHPDNYGDLMNDIGHPDAMLLLAQHRQMLRATYYDFATT